MTASGEAQQRLAELAGKNWDMSAVEARFRHLVDNGIPDNPMDPEEILRQKEEFLDRVRESAEQYCYLTRSCAKGSALALLEAFGLGNMEIVRAMAPFPGLSMSGGICGPVAGGLVALGLYFSHPDPADYGDIAHYVAGRRYIQGFEELLGSLYCPDIQKELLGRAYDPFAGEEELEAFNRSGAREKCPVAPGLGARLAAEIIVRDMEERYL